MIPYTIVEGKPKPNVGTKMITFGSYALVYSGAYNDMKKRSISAIALRKSNNNSGYYFMNLHKGRCIHGYHWTELPIDDYVIFRVEKFAEDEKQPSMHDGMPNFEWSPGNRVEDDKFNNDEDLLVLEDYNEYIDQLMEANQDDSDNDLHHEENGNRYLMLENNGEEDNVEANVLQDVNEEG